jgi:hypothetical protein
MEERTGSAITESLVDMLRARDLAGKRKYGTSLDRGDLNVFEWAQHMLEELCDGAGYLEALIRELRNLPLNPKPMLPELHEVNPAFAEGFVLGWERYHNILCAKLGLDPNSPEASNIFPGGDQEGRAGEVKT